MLNLDKRLIIFFILFITIIVLIVAIYNSLGYIHIYEDIGDYSINEISIYNYKITKEYEEDNKMLTDFKESKSDAVYTMLGHYKGSQFVRLAWEDVVILEIYF